MQMRSWRHLANSFYILFISLLAMQLLMLTFFFSMHLDRARWHIESSSTIHHSSIILFFSGLLINFARLQNAMLYAQAQHSPHSNARWDRRTMIYSVYLKRRRDTVIPFSIFSSSVRWLLKYILSVLYK